jgi:hypothetical protein
MIGTSHVIEDLGDGGADPFPQVTRVDQKGLLIAGLEAKIISESSCFLRKLLLNSVHDTSWITFSSRGTFRFLMASKVR